MNKQFLIIIVLIVAVGGIGYGWYTSILPGAAETPVVIDEALESQLVSYRRLQDVEFDMAAFQDEFLRELVPIPDLLTPLVPSGQSLGRPNPYAAAADRARFAPSPVASPTGIKLK